jgi:hypothetical protein
MQLIKETNCGGSRADAFAPLQSGPLPARRHLQAGFNIGAFPFWLLPVQATCVQAAGGVDAVKRSDGWKNIGNSALSVA